MNALPRWVRPAGRLLKNMEIGMMTQTDLRHKLQEAQRHLVEAARAVDGASVNVRTLLERLEQAQAQAPYTPKPANDTGDRADED